MKKMSYHSVSAAGRKLHEHKGFLHKLRHPMSKEFCRSCHYDAWTILKGAMSSELKRNKIDLSIEVRDILKDVGIVTESVQVGDSDIQIKGLV